MDASRATTHARWARMIAAIGSGVAGIGQEQLYAEAGISHFPDDPEARITQEETTALWQALDRLSGRPWIGLETMDYFHIGDLGPLGLALLTSDCYRNLLKDILRLSPVVGETWRFAVEMSGEVVIIKLWAVDDYVSWHSYDAVIATFLRASREWLSTEPPEYPLIELGHPDFGVAETYQLRYGVPCRFDQPAYRLHLTASCLDIPLPGSDPRLHEVLVNRLERQIEALHGVAAETQLIIESLLEAGRPVARREVARHLALGERTLLRRLEAEGCTFSQLRTQAIKAQAETLLGQGLTGAQVAERLGYSDASALGRMLKRAGGSGIRGHRKK